MLLARWSRLTRSFSCLGRARAIAPLEVKRDHNAPAVTLLLVETFIHRINELYASEITKMTKAPHGDCEMHYLVRDFSTQRTVNAALSRSMLETICMIQLNFIKLNEIFSSHGLTRRLSGPMDRCVLMSLIINRCHKRNDKSLFIYLYIIYVKSTLT